MPLDIDDGYTLDDVTPGTDAEGLPVKTVAYSYRPPLPAALYDWRYRLSVAMSGDAQLQASADFIAKQLVRWDVTASKKPAPTTAEIVKRLPEPVINHMAKKIASWAGYRPDAAPNAPPSPTAMEDAEKNSHTA